MTANEKSAFLRLLGDAVIHIRAWSGPAYQQSAEQSQAALRHVNALADLFHNLARYSADDFAGFQTELFWQQFRHYRQRIPELYDFEAAYRSYLHGNAA
jgi:hypothetical protein